MEPEGMTKFWPRKVRMNRPMVRTWSRPARLCKGVSGGLEDSLFGVGGSCVFSAERLGGFVAIGFVLPFSFASSLCPVPGVAVKSVRRGDCGGSISLLSGAKARISSPGFCEGLRSG